MNDMTKALDVGGRSHARAHAPIHTSACAHTRKPGASLTQYTLTGIENHQTRKTPTTVYNISLRKTYIIDTNIYLTL